MSRDSQGVAGEWRSSNTAWCRFEHLLVCSADADCAYLTVCQMQLPEAVATV